MLSSETVANDELSASKQLISAEEKQNMRFLTFKTVSSTSGHTVHECRNSLHTEAQGNTAKSWLLNPEESLVTPALSEASQSLHQAQVSEA